MGWFVRGGRIYTACFEGGQCCINTSSTEKICWSASPSQHQRSARVSILRDIGRDNPATSCSGGGSKDFATGLQSINVLLKAKEAPVNAIGDSASRARSRPTDDCPPR